MFDEKISDNYSWTDVKKELTNILQIFEKHDIIIKPGSRIFRYNRILEALENERLEDLPDEFSEKKFHQISIEVFQLSKAVHELSKSKYFNDWSKKIHFLTSGRELPEKDKDHRSRNYQFELYVAGMLKEVGIEPICKEPDIQVKWKNGTFGIAIKRPNSFKKLAENLRKARNQILKNFPINNQPMGSFDFCSSFIVIFVVAIINDISFLSGFSYFC